MDETLVVFKAVPVLAEDREAGWVRILYEYPVCDLCGLKAVFAHPAGGLRCRRCPRPEL